jgi:hypothetical protein
MELDSDIELKRSFDAIVNGLKTRPYPIPQAICQHLIVPPLAKHNFSLVPYEQDLLPEHLWLASLVEKFGDRAHRPFYDLLDALDVVWLGDFPPIGFLSDFILVPENIRNDFKNNHAELIRVAFHDLIGRPLAFYPEGPGLLVDRPACPYGRGAT